MSRSSGRARRGSIGRRLAAVWRQHARSFDPDTLANESHPFKAVLPVLAGVTVLLLAMHYVPPARDFTGLDDPWTPIVLLAVAGLITIVQWLNWQRQRLVRVLVLFDQSIYCLALIAVALDTTSPTRYIWALLYAQVASHYGDRASFGWPLAVSISLIPFAVTVMSAGDDYGLMALVLFGALMFVVKSTTTGHLRRIERERERYRSAYEISDKVASESLEIAIATSVAEFGGFAHELRNASTPILGNLMILKEQEDLSVEAREALDGLERSFGRSFELMEKMLSSIKRRVGTEQGSFLLNEVVDSGVLGECLPPADRGKLEVLPARHPFEIRGNPEHLSGAMANLVENAVGAGAKKVRVEVSMDGGCKCARVLVADDGPGIPKSVLETLFHAGTRSPKGGSHGLGLPLSKRLVDVLGGSLRLRETGPEGTVFEIILSGRFVVESGDDREAA